MARKKKGLTFDQRLELCKLRLEEKKFEEEVRNNQRVHKREMLALWIRIGLGVLGVIVTAIVLMVRLGVI